MTILNESKTKKRYSMNEADLASYRPTSNLNTVNKIVEYLFLARIHPNRSSLGPLYCMRYTSRHLDQYIVCATHHVTWTITHHATGQCDRASFR